MRSFKVALVVLHPVVSRSTVHHLKAGELVPRPGANEWRAVIPKHHLGIFRGSQHTFTWGPLTNQALMHSDDISATSLLGSFMFLLLILVNTAPPSAASVPRLGWCKDNKCKLSHWESWYLVWPASALCLQGCATRSTSAWSPCPCACLLWSSPWCEEGTRNNPCQNGQKRYTCYQLPAMEFRGWQERQWIHPCLQQSQQNTAGL